MCPTCKGPLVRSKTLIEGETVLQCQSCNLFTVEGSNRWIPGGAQLQAGLIELARQAEEARNIDREALTSPDDDPRWTHVMW